MFGRWRSNPRFPTLKRVYRQVYVDMHRALPESVGGFVRGRNLTVRADGMRIEAWMRGYQIAWMRTSQDRWLGVVVIDVLSENEMSSTVMTLWLAPSMFQINRPDGFFEDPYRRRRR
ncbi:hypothetical protein [Mycobacteroides chelonae]|uniref:hypothetical protein n=1 Tax=Mycobacteroides chelonae TaxID=1774 RepID=UPI0008A9CF71|nr:hypothetical protein [Mycobacteroides chelonae]OHU29125.1 hypothetical protein BKG78_23290 [Mycobacteroides chelonae]